MSIAIRRAACRTAPETTHSNKAFGRETINRSGHELKENAARFWLQTIN